MTPAAASHAASPATLASIVAIAADVAGRPAAAGSSFADLAFDSLMCIEFVAAVEDAHGVEISCHERLGFDTLAEVAALVDARAPAPALPMAA